MTYESVLIRECAPLYVSFALEALANFMLGCTFCYLVLLIACKNQLENPGWAALKMIGEHVSWAFGDWCRMMSTWTTMPHLTLDQRMAFCRKLNFGICIAQVISSFLALTRWLHIGNINGMRYFGYAITCSLLQAELVILISPFVPFFKTNVIGVALLTFTTMIAGWVGSLKAGQIWEEDSFSTFVETLNPADIIWTSKGYTIMPSFICLGVLILVQIPALAMIFLCNGGWRPHRNLPYHFLRLLLLVEVTWPCFGIWWFLSAEGEGIIHDTKANTFGFCGLNMLSKGGFTLMMLRLGREHRKMWAEDCPVTPKAVNEDLWIVKQLRPYDPSSVQHEKKYTDSDLDGAVARVLAQHGIDMRRSPKRSPSPFGFPESPKSPGPVTLLGSNGAVRTKPSLESSAPSIEAPRVADPPAVSRSAPFHQALTQIPQAATHMPQTQGQSQFWPCNCDTKPAVVVLTVNEEGPGRI